MRRGLLALSALAVGGLLLWARSPVPTVRAANATVTWEAEDPKGGIEAPFQRKQRQMLDNKPKPQKNSGTGYVEIKDKANGDKKEGDGSSLPGFLKFKVKVPEAGQYKLWGRVLWPDGCGNSFFVCKQGRPNQILGEDGTYDSWHWVELQGPKLTLAAGVNTIEVHNREDGVILDQLQITTGGRVPTGEQRVTSGAVVD